MAADAMARMVALIAMSQQWKEERQQQRANAGIGRLESVWFEANGRVVRMEDLWATVVATCLYSFSKHAKAAAQLIVRLSPNVPLTVTIRSNVPPISKETSSRPHGTGIWER
jgi:hypothetical protein